MTRQSLTEQDIIHAATAIAATGVMPTIAEVRKYKESQHQLEWDYKA